MVDMPIIQAEGKRGDELVKTIKENLEKIGSSDKIVRLKVTGVSEETLKTLPTAVLAELKQKSFALNIQFEKEKIDESTPQFGRAGIGQIDERFIQFLDSADLKGFDKEKLKTDALRYLSSSE